MPEPTEPPASFERKALRAYGRGCLRTLALQLVGLVVGLTLVIWTLWFVAGRAASGAATRGEILTETGLPVLVLVVVTTLAAVFVVHRKARRLDQVFLPWCGEGRQSGPAMRGWHGHAGGRRLDAWVSRGPKVEIYLECAGRTRAWINRGGAVMRRINRLLKKEPIDNAAARELEVSLYADDPQWLDRLLAAPAAKAALEKLMSETGDRTSTALNVLPNALHFMKIFVPLQSVERDRVGAWIHSLEDLAATIDEIGPSSAAQAATRQDNWTRTDRGAATLNRALLWIYGIGLFVLLGLVLLFTFVLPIGGG